MARASDIGAGMEVVGADGAHVGVVDHVQGDRIRLAQGGASDGRAHDLPLAAVATVDDKVRLSMSGATALSIAGAPASGMPSDAIATDSIVPPAHNRAIAGAPARGNFYLPWIIGLIGLVLLALLVLRLVAPHPRPLAPTVTEAHNAPPSVAVPLPARMVTLPNGTAVSLVPQTLPYNLQAYLASPDPAPRTFIFDRLNFDTGSAAVRADDQATIDALTAILNAYPHARVALVGYTDARGAPGDNADLGRRRAQAVIDALAAKGADRDRMAARTGGENDPVDTNATPAGRFENRRSELVVIEK